MDADDGQWWKNTTDLIINYKYSITATPSMHFYSSCTNAPFLSPPKVSAIEFKISTELLWFDERNIKLAPENRLGKPSFLISNQSLYQGLELR